MPQFQPARGARGLRITRSDLIRIVFARDRQERRHHGKAQHRIELRLRSLNRRGQLAAEAIELIEKKEQLAHRRAAS